MKDMSGKRLSPLICKAYSCIYFYVEKFLFLWDKCTEVILLGHMVSVYLVFKEISKYFPEWVYHIRLPQCMRDPVSPNRHQHLILLLLFTVAVLVGV